MKVYERECKHECLQGVSGDMVVSNCGVQILFWPLGSAVVSNRGKKYAV